MANTYKGYGLTPQGNAVPYSGGSAPASVLEAENAQKLGGVPAGDYALKTDTVANSDKLGGKAPEHYLSAVNLLDNSDWRVKDRIINQRGKTAYSGIRKYTIDRWYIYKNSTTDGILTIENNGISVDGFLYQLLDINKINENTVYTLAIKKTDEDFLIYSSTFENSTGSTTFYFSGNYAVVRIASGSYLWAALYEGTYTADTLPPFVPHPYAVELAECKRRFQIIGGKNSYGYIGTAVAVSATQLRMGVQIPVEMAAAPDVHAYGNLLAVNSAFVPITDVIFNVSDTTSAMVYLNAAGGLTPGETYIIMANNDGTARIELDSDL